MTTPAEPTPVFVRDGDAFMPTASAGGPWDAKALHGASSLGLMAYGAERALTEPSFQPVRFTADLFRPVPKQRLQLETQVLRAGRRIQVVHVRLIADVGPVAQVTALFALQPDPEAADDDPWPDAPMPSIDLGEVSSIWGGRARPGLPYGLHYLIQVRWVATDTSSTAAWFHLPVALIEGEQTSPFVQTVALGDFANAIIGRSSRSADRSPRKSFINADSSVYFARRPQGSWLGMRVEHKSDRGELSIGQVSLHDPLGRFGTSTQARLNQAR